MSKKKPTKKTRPASAAPRKRVASRSSRAGRGPAGRPQSGKVQLKPILVLIERALVDLKRLPQAESIAMAIKQLDIARMAINDVCDPDIPGGCGPTMEFPPAG
jgi:hypothetical protein